QPAVAARTARGGRRPAGQAAAAHAAFVAAVGWPRAGRARGGSRGRTPGVPARTRADAFAHTLGRRTRASRPQGFARRAGDGVVLSALRAHGAARLAGGGDGNRPRSGVGDGPGRSRTSAHGFEVDARPRPTET